MYVSWVQMGVVLDSKMNWLVHTQTLKKYILNCTRQLYNLKNFCSQKVLLMIYYGIVQSKIQYGITCWGGAYFNKINPIFIAQKHLIRVISKQNRFSGSLFLFRQLQVLPLRYLYFYKVLRLFFLRSGFLSIRDNANHNLRINSRNYVQIPSYKKKSLQNLFFFRCSFSF